MIKKQKMELLLSKVPEEQKAAFVAELREAKNMEAIEALVKKYGISLTAEEENALKSRSNELSDEELDQVAGGGCNDGPPGGKCSCSGGCTY